MNGFNCKPCIILILEPFIIVIIASYLRYKLILRIFVVIIVPLTGVFFYGCYNLRTRQNFSFTTNLRDDITILQTIHNLAIHLITGIQLNDILAMQMSSEDNHKKK